MCSTAMWRSFPKLKPKADSLLRSVAVLTFLLHITEESSRAFMVAHFLYII